MSFFRPVLVPRERPLPLIKHILEDELKGALAVTAKFQDGLTIGGDVQFEHARLSAAAGSIRIETSAADQAEAADSFIFSDGSTCRHAERGHECVANSDSNYPGCGKRWQYDAQYRMSDTSPHLAAAHATYPGNANPNFHVVVSWGRSASEKYISSWFAMETYETDVSL